ncbi:MAG: TonB-dependent receptor [Candidatus Acidiferrales bacterium]
MNFKNLSVGILLLALSFALGPANALAQETLGWIDGTVTDASGAVVQGAMVKAHNVATNLTVTAQTKADGSFHVADLPIGIYEVTFARDGFKSANYPGIRVQGGRTATVNTQLQPGTVTSTVTVNATPLLNQTDTTNGYVLGDLQMQNIPLGTGSFTQMAILSPGVSADLLNTSGTNAGLGNQSVWADGQRDTSNSFSLNGVNANNIFNGKSSSQLTSGRVAVNVGESGNSVNNPSGQIVTSTSVYGAIGQALPSPPIETIQEMRVNSAMYDASQGANSGAHIEVSTKSGTNEIHGGAYEYFQTTDFDANQWFFNFNSLPRPSLSRNVYGGFVGAPIKKDKIFFFASYQGQRVFDQLLGTSYAAVPPDLTDARDATTIAAVANEDFKKDGCGTGTNPPCLNIQPGQITPQALAILNLKTKSGAYFIPSAETDPTVLAHLQTLGADAVVEGSGSQFLAHQLNGNIDFIVSPQDRLAAKYYFQKDPNTTPFANSTLLGFPQTMNAGGQSLSLDNTTILSPNLSWEQRLGFVRERAYAVTTGAFNASDAQIALPGLTAFPQMSLYRADGYSQGSNDYNLGNSLSIGPLNNFANAGIFQNNFELATSLNWVHGRHTISTGVNWDYTQLNVVNRNNEVSRVTFEDFPGFLEGIVCGPNTTYCSGQDPSQILNGGSNRYFRANQAGAYVQDDWKIKSNLSLNLGLRWDWDGPLNEKNGFLTNFYPRDYSYDVASDEITGIGLVVAGNNKTFGTKGVSPSTITGRQWGFAPRIGLVYSPSFLKNFVIRTGFGMYYDRGEYFTELSSPAGGGISGPFGVTVAEPFVVPFYAVSGGGFAAPFGTAAIPPPPSNLQGIAALIPNAADLINNTTPYCDATGQFGCGPLLFGGYDPKNKLPYSENWTLDLQWQPINTVVMSLGYVGNHGVHQVIPLPFNQALIATPQNPVLSGGPNEQIYSYGYNVPGVAAESLSTLVAGYGTGNAALRAPYLGYDPNSNYNEAIGESNYSALQFQVTKHFSQGLMITGSYTYSHTLDEQSGLGLFFTGNDPNNVHSSYGTSDFDRTHVFVATYMYQLPTKKDATGWEKWTINGWGLNGITVLQSGQPYSVNDYSGGAGSIYFGGGQDEVTNPIVPVGGVGATATNPRLQGTTGINANKPVLNAAAFGVPAPFAPGTNGVPPCDPSGACDYYETGYASGGRNIFRGPFQTRFDFGLFKNFQLTERFATRVDLQAFNIFNHPSFDIPDNNVSFNPYYNNPPVYGSGTGYTACVPATGAYACPPSGHLGVIQHTIGSPRFLQLAVHFTF